MAYSLPTNISDRPIAVIGGGTLGSRIALMMATQGADIRIHARTISDDHSGITFACEHLADQVKATKDGKPGRIIAAKTMAEAVQDAWIVFESVPEELEIKRQIFAELDRLTAADCILASNSSSYPSSRFIDDVKHPERVLNTHFLMPPMINSVELMSDGQTDPRIIELLMEVFPRYGLTPYHVLRESVGFIFNRIWAAIKRESLAVAAEGVATPDTVDRIFAQNLGTTHGPFRMMDMVGLDVVLSIEEHYAQVLQGVPESPRNLLRDMIAEGRLGVKSGKGFYDDYSG